MVEDELKAVLRGMIGAIDRSEGQDISDSLSTIDGILRARSPWFEEVQEYTFLRSQFESHAVALVVRLLNTLLMHHAYLQICAISKGDFRYNVRPMLTKRCI